MGSKNSKGSGRREFPSYGSGSSSTYNQQYGYPPQTPYHQPGSYGYTPQHQHGPPPPSSSYGSQASFNYGSEIPVAQPHRKLDRKYSRIADNYRSLDEVRPICGICVCDFLSNFEDHLFFLFVFCLVSCMEFWDYYELPMHFTILKHKRRRSFQKILHVLSIYWYVHA